jgi:Protein of unknown function (DUF3500)/Immunoglobulin I-set domain
MNASKFLIPLVGAALLVGASGVCTKYLGGGADMVASAVAATTRGIYTNAPVIGSQPGSQSVSAGSSVTFSVIAYGAATLSYQWRKDGTNINGATASSYSIASASGSDAGSYDVVVTNSKGSATSTAATLSVTQAATGTQTADTVAAAKAFYNSLSSTQQTTVQLSWNLDSARKWSNLPAAMVARNGLAWSALSSAQKTAAQTLIASALGTKGATLFTGMQAADNYLNSIGGGSSYGEGNYYITFHGTPSTSTFWMLQVTGHHLTYNVSFNGSYKSATPMFLAVEPKASFSQGGNTYDPMSAQRVAVANLGAALTSYSTAKLSGTYSDLVFGANGSGGIDGTCPRAYSSYSGQGISYANLSSTHQALVQEVIKSYVNTQGNDVASDLLSAYLSDTALASTYVAYSGSGTVTTRGDYFRINGPRVWIEFSVQSGVIVRNDIHYHTVWRDKAAEYGGLCGQS